MANYQATSQKLKFIFIGTAETPVPHFVSSLTKRGEKEWILQLEDIDNRTKAMEISSETCYLPDDIVNDYFVMAEEKEETWGKLEGFLVLSQKGDDIGIIEWTEETAGNVVAGVNYLGKEVMLPLHEDLILELDEELRVIKLKIAQGLLE